jgi:hypothetical protein
MTPRRFKKAKWSKLLVHGELVRFSATLECGLMSMTSQITSKWPEPWHFQPCCCTDFFTDESPPIPENSRIVLAIPGAATISYATLAGEGKVVWNTIAIAICCQEGAIFSFYPNTQLVLHL